MTLSFLFRRVRNFIVNPYTVLWRPPVSPYGLLEEELYADPWKLLVGCMLLNKTSGVQVGLSNSTAISKKMYSFR